MQRYQKTLKEFENILKYYETELIKYYLNLFFNRNNKVDKHVQEKNAAIFTYFNNVPDVFHPLKDDIYYNYACYLSYIDPSFFRIKFNGHVIKHRNILKYKMYRYPLVKQYPAPYGKFKRSLSINIKYFCLEDYLRKDYVILLYTDTRNKYIINPKDCVPEIKGKIVYVNILRPFKSEELMDIYKMKTIKKGTKLYSYHKRDKMYYNPKHIPSWFTFDPKYFGQDPYNVETKAGDPLVLFTWEVIKDFKAINLCQNVFMQGRGFRDFDKILTDEGNDDIYDGFMNFIEYNANGLAVLRGNRGKRLLKEIMLKSSNFDTFKIYYFDYLTAHGCDYLYYNPGFYQGINNYCGFELGLRDRPESRGKIIRSLKIEDVVFIPNK